MFRSVMVEEIGEKLFEGAPDAIRNELYEVLGVELECFGVQVSDAACVLLHLLCGLLFLAAGVLVTKRAVQNDR